MRCKPWKFLSTLSLRRATLTSCTTTCAIKFLSTLSLRRATQAPEHRGYPLCISIHALLAESDTCSVNTQVSTVDFYPRSPCGERPAAIKPSPRSIEISIHALLAESDNTRPLIVNILTYFYPRSPCGERLRLPAVRRSECRFLSTLSLRRATGNSEPGGHMGSNFYPRSPCGERRSSFVLHLSNQIISIHALLAESDISSS